jgi:hypothetical protein
MRRYLLALAILACAGAATGFLLFGSQGRAEAQQPITVIVGDFFYCDSSQSVGACRTVIDPGDTITWSYRSGSTTHTVTECGASCNSPTIEPLFLGTLHPGDTFSFTFASSGAYLYHCQIHPTQMQATVFVRGATASPAPTAALTPLPTLEPTPAPSEEPSPVPSITLSPTRSPRSQTPQPSPSRSPVHVSLDDGGGSFPWVLLIIGFFTAAALAGGGWFAYRSLRTPPPPPPPRPPSPPPRP